MSDCGGCYVDYTNCFRLENWGKISTYLLGASKGYV